MKNQLNQILNQNQKIKLNQQIFPKKSLYYHQPTPEIPSSSAKLNPRKFQYLPNNNFINPSSTSTSYSNLYSKPANDLFEFDPFYLPSATEPKRTVNHALDYIPSNIVCVFLKFEVRGRMDMKGAHLFVSKLFLGALCVMIKTLS